MADNSDNQSVLAKELDDLISLAESSATTLDALLKTAESTRAHLALYTILLYVCGSLSLGAFFALTRDKPYFGLLPQSGILVALLLGLLIIAALMYASYTKYIRLAKTRRDLRVERDIHKRLLSLIDDQVRRTRSERSLSPVAQATIDIRIRRLDRTDRTR